MSTEESTEAARLSVFGRFFRQLPCAFGWAIAGFAIFNLFGELVRPWFDANVLWMPLLLLGTWGGRILLGLTAWFLLWSLLRPALRPWRSRVTQTLLALLTFFAVIDGIKFYQQLRQGEIQSTLPLPLAWLVALVLLLQIWRVRRAAVAPPRPAAAGKGAAVVTTVLGVAGVVEVFLLAQFFLFGGTGYLGKADCIIVMGAGVTPDGSASRSLLDRTLIGCRLLLDGKAEFLIFSGGPTKVGVSEPEVMAGIATENRIPRNRYILDERGSSTYATVINTRRLMRENGWKTAIVVSHDYHLSRTALAFRRAGVAVQTYPARRSRVMWTDAFNVFRESAAWVYYYFRPLWEPLGACEHNIANYLSV